MLTNTFNHLQGGFYYYHSIENSLLITSWILKNRPPCVLIPYFFSSNLPLSLCITWLFSGRLCAGPSRIMPFLFLSNLESQRDIGYKQILHKNLFWVPWWLSGKDSGGQCRRYGFHRWSGKIPHAAEQLSPCATSPDPVPESPAAATTEPSCGSHWSQNALDPMLHKRSHRKEKPELCHEA